MLLQRDLPKARTAAQRAMCELCVLQEHGFRQVFGGLWKRRGFALLLLLAMAGAFVIPKFVFFYEVVGNETVPEAQILRELQNLGVGFGTYGPSIRPQELKNRMLLQIPKLQWLTVQQSGMRACVVVRERPEAIAVEERRAPMNVVAGKDGVITSVSAMEGNCLCARRAGSEKGAGADFRLHRSGIYYARLRCIGRGLCRDARTENRALPGHGAAENAEREEFAQRIAAGGRKTVEYFRKRWKFRRQM